MKYLSLLLIATLVIACSSPKTSEESTETDEFAGQEFIPNDNPPADGFNGEASSPIAVILADKVMNAMGGRPAWDRTRYISWNFFGSRKLLWDKQTGNVRIDNLRDDRIVLININDDTGKVFKNGMEQTDPDSISTYLDWGKKVWINDSYWLVMPFKLKDSGVTLNYVGESQTLVGEVSEKIRLTFEEVGVTPQNAYDIWVSSESNLVKQWAYYPNATDTMPRWTLPWDNYQKMGEILLSDDRGDRDLSDVQVLESVPDGIFSSFEVTM